MRAPLIYFPCHALMNNSAFGFAAPCCSAQHPHWP
jgi:hypothetical protein